jgi:hypothetical protein
MQSTDRVEFLKVLNGMAAMKKSTVVPESMDLWWACMADWSIEDFKAAAVHVLKTATFMPTPADFEELRKAGREKAGEAWDRAVRHASSSAYRHGPLGDALIDQCVRVLGGYEAIARSDVSSLHFLERRFCEHFDSIQDAGDVRKSLPQIAKQDWLQGCLADAQKRLTQ